MNEPPQTDLPTHEGPPTVAIVLSGAAARGAFQAGALAELLPTLAREGMEPTIVLGTSAGSINAALWGSMIQLGPRRAADQLVDTWSRMSHANVFEPLLCSSWQTAAQFARGALFACGGGTTSLLDTDPLRRTAAATLDAAQLHANVETGRLTAVGLVATRVPPAAAATAGTSSGRSVLFLDEHEPSGYTGDPDRAQDVARGPLRAEHVIASSAIPMAFPAQHVDEPPDAAGWYVDGGIRLNTPVRPAIALGADRVVVISATSTRYGAPLAPDPAADVPDLADAGAQAMHAVLADRMIEDLLAVRRTNRMLAQVAGAGPHAAPVLRRADGTPYRTIHLMTVSPLPGELARLASDVAARTTSGLGALRETDNWLLDRALRGAGDASGRRELLSYLLFDETYFTESIRLGRAAARRALAAGWEV